MRGVGRGEGGERCAVVEGDGRGGEGRLLVEGGRSGRGFAVLGEGLKRTAPRPLGEGLALALELGEVLIDRLEPTGGTPLEDPDEAFETTIEGEDLADAR